MEVSSQLYVLATPQCGKPVRHLRVEPQFLSTVLSLVMTPTVLCQLQYEHSIAKFITFVLSQFHLSLMALNHLYHSAETSLLQFWSEITVWGEEVLFPSLYMYRKKARA